MLKSIHMKVKKQLYKTINQYPVIVQEDESGGYWVNCPSLQGCYSQGETIDEALQNIQEAIVLCLDDIPKKERLKKQQKQVSLHFVHV